jgi:hypothetical protein
MADLNEIISEIELVLSLETDYTVTDSDWYEWRENALIAFLERVRSEISGDATISAYLDGIAVVNHDDLSRYDIRADNDDNLIVIHSPHEVVSEEEGGSGRNNRHLHCSVTAFTRNPAGLDANNQEIQLIGDGTADKPGTLEIMEDLRALFTGNYLSSGGVKYLWDMLVGEITTPEDVDEHTAEILSATITLEGLKWDYLWS